MVQLKQTINNTLHITAPKATITKIINGFGKGDDFFAWETMFSPPASTKYGSWYMENWRRKRFGTPEKPTLTLVEASHTEVYYEFDTARPVTNLAIAVSKRFKSALVTYAHYNTAITQMNVISKSFVQAYQAGAMVYLWSGQEFEEFEIDDTHFKGSLAVSNVSTQIANA